MLTPLTSVQARRLREFLADARYTHESFQQAPELRELGALPGSSARWLERFPEASAQNLLLRLFLLGLPQPVEEIARFVPEAVRRLMLECGLLAETGDHLAPQVMLTPCDEYVFAADGRARVHSHGAGDGVLWPNPSTRLLQMFKVPVRSRLTLDLGAGCGMIGILAAAQSERVVATDLNARAEQFVLFNCSLNGVDNLEALTGDTFEPVRGRRFDLILANPPFFVTPGSGQLYCENDMQLDLYCRRVVREAAGHLTEGGYFQAMLEWVQVGGQPWQERLAEWVEGSGCDAWVLRRYARDAAAYAQERIRTTFPEEDGGPRLAEWMAYYRQHGVEEVHGGMIAMRRRSGKNWLRMEDLAVEGAQPFGDAVMATFATQDVLAAQTADEGLLATKPRLPADAELAQTLRASNGQWASASLTLRLTGGLPASLAVDPHVAALLGECDGTRTLEELAERLAAKVGVGREQARQQSCAVVRKLAERRLVLLAL